MFGRFASSFTRASSPPWTCRACLRESKTIGNGSRNNIINRRLLHTRFRPLCQKTVEKEGGNVRRWASTFRTTAKPNRTRKVLVFVSVTAIVGASIAYSVGEHGLRAAQRSARVVSTLFVCINDYRDTLQPDDSSPEYAAALKACHKRCAERTLATMEANGSIFIKLGQHLSSLNYLLPSEWCTTFIPLQDKCPVSSYASIKEMVEHDTGAKMEDLFASFEELPIGAASLAQVHRATMRDTGEQVAVKVQHPTLDEWAPLDLALTKFTFDTLKRFFPEYDLTWLAEEMQVSLPQELDFIREAANADRAREYFKNNVTVREAPVVVPRVIWAKRRVLVMEYVTGHRPDDLEYLDGCGIDRDDVSAALARLFNAMIFGVDAPLHCDPHGGNIAIRYNAKRSNPNFDLILYDHGLYRDLPQELRREYAKLWLAVLDGDVEKMRVHAKGVAGVQDEDFELFASAITGRDFSVLVDGEEGVRKRRNAGEKRRMGNALTGGEGILAQLVQLLGKIPRVLLLVLKTNDLTRSLDENLKTKEGPARTFLILARYASRTVYAEAKDALARSSRLSPWTWLALLKAWFAHFRVEVKLTSYESWLRIRRMLGLRPILV